MRTRILATTIGALALIATPQASASARPTAERAVEEVRAAKRGDASAPSVAVATRNLALAVPALRGSERAAAERLLARPTDPGGDGYLEYTDADPEAPPACGLRFCIHYVTTGVDAPDLTDAKDAAGDPGANGVPDFIDLMLREFEYVGRRENSPAPTGLGWPDPVPDGTEGGDDRFDVYVGEIADDGVYGYANFEQADDPDSNSLPAYMAMDNSYSEAEFGYPDPLIPLDVTAAHEYNHVLQGAIDARFDVWFGEATATWMEDQVFPEGDDWQLYLARWGKDPQVPITSFDLVDDDPTNIRVYGTSIFMHWLSDQYGPAAVRNAWLGLPDATPAVYSPGALDDALAVAGGTSTSDAFGRFAAATAEWQLPASGIHDAGQFAARVRREPEQLTDGSTVSAPLDHLGFRLYDVSPEGAGDAKLTLTAPAGTAASVALVGRRGPDATGTLETRQVRLPIGGTATVTLPDPGSFSRITAVVANTDTSVDPESPFDEDHGIFDWHYGGDDGTFTASLSTAATPAEPTPVTPAPVVVAPPATTVVTPPAAAPAAPAPPLPAASGPDAAAVRSAVRAARDAVVDALGDRRFGTLRSRARTFAFDAPVAGRLTVTVAAGGRTLARGATSTTRARLLRGRVALTATGVQALRADRRIRATATVRFVPRTGPAVTVTRRVTLTR
ncbi:MXAN_6640 family putative metalloprotease [Patulibacter sp. NPDC049589]|uniref:MXAN_6640 family putative metalloprotease n=1 Tax=Patulibacter sp. NPDC049589 TaxID=3154731 RepID=UPI003440C7C2